jgi:hypothetical protein
MNIEKEVILEYIKSTIGEPETWSVTNGYPNALALAIIDAIYSIGVHYKSVENVIERYRELRGAQAETDGTSELIETFDQLGGVAGWINTVGNGNLTSAINGVPKAEAVLAAARALLAVGITDANSFRSAVGSEGGNVVDGTGIQKSWESLKGQGSGISWNYICSLVGLRSIKPDRMIKRFMSDALGRELPDDDVVDALLNAADSLGVEPRQLDFNIWQYQRSLKDSK